MMLHWLQKMLLGLFEIYHSMSDIGKKRKKKLFLQKKKLMQTRETNRIQMQIDK